MKKIVCVVLVALLSIQINAQEILFTNYFDIETNQSEGRAVIGKINLKSNKDFLTKDIPETYKFEIDHNKSVFKIETAFDHKGRIFGVLKVSKGNKTSSSPEDIALTVSLKDGRKVIAIKNIVIHVVKKTMWQELFDGYSPVTLSVKRLYGRKKMSDKKVLKLVDDLEQNNGQFSFSEMYGKQPSEYKSTKALMKSWEEVSYAIGGLGYAYGTSKEIGRNGSNAKNEERLKRAIYHAVIEFTNSIPIYGDDVLIDGKPIGHELGDGFSLLSEYKLAGHDLLTHQWRTVDGLGAPLVQVWPEVIEDIANGDEQAQQLYDAVIRYYQLFFSIVPQRRRMDDARQRWKNISDANYSEGAWADANIGHRMRSLMVMPILWVDYNRPITYVPYWYDDYYKGTKFEGLTFADNWSPNGVVADVRSWCDKLSLPSHMFNQSGFHPDGTVTHHSGHNASDVAMVAYGFEWLTTVNTAINYFKNTPLPLKDENYQFITDHLNYAYNRLVYKNSIDYVMAGRSFFADLSNFGTGHVNKNIKKILKGKSPTTLINNEKELKKLKQDFSNGTHSITETTAFWVGDYLMHRKEDEKENYFFSVKHKSVRTSGAEDFSKIRKSWHAASGVFQLRIDGDEYSQEVLANYDWHTLPGVTEEWRTDPLPQGPPASASLPGGNEFSGILSDGTYGLTGYHHKPIDNYTSAEALKSYHFIGRFGTAVGSHIKRKSSSTTNYEIVTTIDQSKHTNVLTYAINGLKKEVKVGESVDLKEVLTSPTWIHHKNKGYLIFPKKNQNLWIKTGAEINVTATDLNIANSSNFILAIDHGVRPSNESKNGYHYVLIANATLKEMPRLLEQYAKNYQLKTLANCHVLTDNKTKIDQIIFYKAIRVEIGKNKWMEVDKPAVVMTQDLGDIIKWTLVDPLHSLNTSEITIKTSEMLKEGPYAYNFPGIKERKGEQAIVTSNGKSSTIVVSLPDSNDGEFYDYREQMYAGAPIVLTLKKMK